MPDMVPSALRVLHTIPYLKTSSGGPGRSAVNICEALAACGPNVHLVSQYRPSSKDDSNLLGHPQGVQTHLVKLVLDSENLRVEYSPFFNPKLVELCRLKNIQIIHDHDLWHPANHTAARVAHRLGIPLVIQPRGTLEPWSLNYKAWKKRIAWALYQRRDLESAFLFVATSHQEAQSIRRLGLRQPMAVIPNGIHLPAQKDRVSTKGETRHALFLSRIHPKKGLLNLVAAWDRIRPKGWEMIVAGPDEENHSAKIEQAVHNNGLQQDFKFVGPVYGAAKEKLYRKVDLFILPTFSENFGIAVAEALSYGVPVITTHGAPWQKLVDNGCGWWVAPTAESIAKAIQEAVSLSDTERYEMGRRGRKLVENEFSWEIVAENMLSVYDWILGLGPKPSCVSTH